MNKSAFLIEMLKEPLFMHLAIIEDQQKYHQIIFFGADIERGSNIIKLFISQKGLRRTSHLLQAGREMAMMMTSLETYQCVQIKGSLLSTRPSNVNEDFIQTSIMNRLIPYNYHKNLYNMQHQPLVTVALEIRELFNQTPGEVAGERIVF